MWLLEKDDTPWTTDEYLKVLAIAGLLTPASGITLVCGSAYLARKAYSGSLALNKRRRTIAKKRRATRQDKKEERRLRRRKPPKVKTNKQKALEVKKPIKKEYKSSTKWQWMTKANKT